MAKITQEELQVLQEQQQRYNQLLFEIGAITLAEIELDKQRKKLWEEKDGLFSDVNNVKQKSEETQAKLVEKYGEIDIDLVTGEFKSL